MITFANQYLLPSLLSQPQRVRRTGLNSLANLRSPTIPHNTSRQFPIIAFATSRQIRYSYLPNTFLSASCSSFLLWEKEIIPGVDSLFGLEFLVGRRRFGWEGRWFWGCSSSSVACPAASLPLLLRQPQSLEDSRACLKLWFSSNLQTSQQFGKYRSTELCTSKPGRYEWKAFIESEKEMKRTLILKCGELKLVIYLCSCMEVVWKLSSVFD